jgi:hypothetical protein
VPVSIVISKLLYTPVFYSLEGVLIKQKISPPASPSLMKKRGNKEKRDKAPLKYSLRWRGVIASNARQQNPARTGEARQNHQQYIGKLPTAGGQGNKS